MMVRTVITWSNVVIPRHFSTMKTAGKYTSSTFNTIFGIPFDYF